jgi:hypothetical protein
MEPGTMPLQMLLVPHGAAGHLRVGDGDQNAAADVAGKVDEAGHLVALLPGHAHVGRVGDGDKAEGQGQHLHHAQPGRGAKVMSRVVTLAA